MLIGEENRKKAPFMFCFVSKNENANKNLLNCIDSCVYWLSGQHKKNDKSLFVTQTFTDLKIMKGRKRKRDSLHVFSKYNPSILCTNIVYHFVHCYAETLKLCTYNIYNIYFSRLSSMYRNSRFFSFFFITNRDIEYLRLNEKNWICMHYFLWSNVLYSVIDGINSKRVKNGFTLYTHVLLIHFFVWWWWWSVEPLKNVKNVIK